LIVAKASADLHESAEDLRDETIDRHRAIVSLMEELEAVDWYDQRIDAATDDELRAILEHNRDEEKEHAAMVLEWLRRRDPALHKHLSTYLFSERAILEVEEEAEKATVPDEASLGIRSLKLGGMQ
jgi:ferritin-like protein